MTRSEYINDIECWSELLDFCHDEDCDYCDYIYDEYTRDDYIHQGLIGMARDVSCWQELLGILQDIPTGYDFYIDDNGEFRGADDDDFENYKYDVLSWGDENEIWDYEENESENIVNESELIEEDEDIDLDEGGTVEELFSSCAFGLQEIKRDEEKIQEQEDNNFKMLIMR